MLKPNLFYKSLGIRKLTQLITGSLHEMYKLQGTRNSIYVHDKSETEDLFVPVFIWLKVNGKIPIYAPEPKEQPEHGRLFTRKYRDYLKELKRHNTRYKYTKQFISNPPDKTPVIIDTSYARKVSYFQESRYKDYYEWRYANEFTIRAINDLSYLGRTIYVFLRPEENTLSPQELVKYAGMDDDSNIFQQKVDTDWKRTLVHLYRYLDTAIRERSIYSKLSTNIIDNIVFVVVSKHRFSLVSLSNLISWAISDIKYLRKATIFFFYKVSSEIEIDDEEETTPDEIIKNGLRSISSLTEPVKPAKKPTIKERVENSTEPKEKIMELIEQELRNKTISRSTYNRYVKVIESRKKAKNPFNPDETLEEAVKAETGTVLDEKEFELPVKDVVPDPTMAKDVTGTLDKKYIRDEYRKDLLKSVMSVENSGILVEEYTVEREDSLIGDVEVHKIKLRPLYGKPSEVKVRLPVINEDGTMTMDGNTYMLRKQRTDAPIRKIASDRVALTSYYGKILIDRSGYKRERYGYWLYSKLLKIYDEPGSPIKIMKTMDVYRNVKGLPLYYTDLARYVSEIVIGSYRLIFDYDRRQEYTKIDPKTVEKRGKILVGIKGKKPILMDNVGRLYIDDEITSIEEMVDLDTRTAPVPLAHTNLLGTRTPIGLILSYLLGFKELLTYLNIKYYEISPNTRVDNPQTEWVLKFADTKLVFPREVSKAVLILSGINMFKKEIANINMADMDNPSTYSKFFTISAMKEIDLQNNLYIDPITLSILKQMKEPVTYTGLLIRAAELLTYDYHSYSQDMNEMVIRGYEKISGFLYKEVTTAIKQQTRKNVFGTSKVELSPYAVWSSIREDAIIVPDLNPIGDLKIPEEVTYLGVGGRSRETMTGESRKYHESDLGVISESSKDSKDIGITMAMSASPNINNTRGIKARDFNIQRDGAASILSTPAMMAPAIDQDDPKRAAFKSIQDSHTIPVVGQEQAMLRTGYDYVLPYRVNNKYALTAEQDGKIVSLSKNKLVIEYIDGARRTYKIGKWYSREEAGVSYLHELKVDKKKGDTFNKGEILYYDTGFFEKDWLHDDKIVYKHGATLRTALVEADQTYEDSSAITVKGSQKLITKSSKVHTYRIDFNTTISDMVEVGSKIKAGDTLFAMSSGTISEDMDEETKKALLELSTTSPSTKYTGIVGRIEIYYTGSIEDMTPSLKKLAEESNNQFSREKGRKVTGDTKGTLLINGKPIDKNQAVIKIYIDVEEPFGFGDKSVFANQLKTTVGEVFTYDITTEDGEPIDAIFGERSVYARIVLSPFIIGTTNTLLEVIRKKAVEAYFE